MQVVLMDQQMSQGRTAWRDKACTHWCGFHRGGSRLHYPFRLYKREYFCPSVSDLCMAERIPPISKIRKCVAVTKWAPRLTFIIDVAQCLTVSVPHNETVRG